MPGFFDFLIGNQTKMKPYNKQGLQALLSLLEGGGLQGNSLYGSGQSYLQNLLSGSPESFQNFQAPYLQNFEQNIVPRIAERFAGMGTGAGGLNSSALQNSLAQAGKNLQVDLAGLHSGLQMQALPQALGYAQQPIQNRLQSASQIPGQYFEMPGQSGLIQSVLSSFAQGLGGGVRGGF